MVGICNPKESGVIAKYMQAAVGVRQTAELVDPNPSLLKQMGLAQRFANGFIQLDNQATVFPEMRPWVDLVKLGEKIRSRFSHMYNPVVRQVADLSSKDSGSIMKVAEALNAGMEGTENADGSYTITADRPLVGLKKGETFTLPAALNKTRKEVAQIYDHIYDNVISAVKASLGVDPSIPTSEMKGADKAVIQLLEEARRTNYIPQVRRGRYAVEYLNRDALLQDIKELDSKPSKTKEDLQELDSLKRQLQKGGKKFLESFESSLDTSGVHTSRKRAEARVAALKKEGMEGVRLRDLQEERNLYEMYAPDIDSLSGIDALFQSIMVPHKTDAYLETKKVIDRLRAEAERGRQGRLRRRKDVPGWLRPDNFDGYFRSTFPSYTFMMSDWIANKATELGRRSAINATRGEVRTMLEDAEQYLHADDSATARLKSVAFLYTIGGNISSALTQPTQLLHTSLPFLAGVAGTGRSTQALMKSAGQLLRHMKFTLDPSTILDIDKMNIAEDEKELIRTMFKDGIAEPLLTRDQAPSWLASNMDPNVYALGRTVGKVLESFSLAFSMSETINRVATGLATYRLVKDPKTFARLQEVAKNTGTTLNTPLDAVEYAVNETQFTMGKGFRAANMRGMVGGLALQFTPFAFKMLGFQRRAMQYYGGKGILSLDAGKKVMALHLLGLFATAGLWGLPFAAPVGDLLDKLLKEVGPELGLTPVALKAELRETLQTLFKEVPELAFVGTPAELADYVFNGPFRATGIDISKRTALDVIPENLLSLDLLNMGPLLGAVKGGVEDAVMYQRKGLDMMAIASLLPVSVRNLARSQVMQEEGYITPGKLEPTLPAREMQSLDDIFKVAIGFTPTQVSRARESLREIKDLGEKMDSLRRSYSDRIARATANYTRTKDPAYQAEAVALYKEVTEFDKGKVLRDRVIQDPSSFDSTINKKIESILNPQSEKAVREPVRSEYMARVRPS